MLKYNPEVFTKIYNTQLGQDIWSFLNTHDNIIRMVTASDLQRPAIEPLSEVLIAKFEKEFDIMKQNEKDQTKKMMGHMVKQIMANQNYEHTSKNIKIRFGNLFSYASRYSRRK